MATSRGFSTVLLSAIVPFHQHWLTSVNTRLCPLVLQVRNRNANKVRFKAPHVPKEKDRWSKAASKKTETRTEKKSVLSESFLARVPKDDVWIRAFYPRPKFTLEECLVRHQEYADPSMLDNMDGFVYADMELNMKTNKKTKFLPQVKGTVLLPHQFEQSQKLKIAIFCKNEADLQKASALGATFVGCGDLIRQVQERLVTKDEMDVVICTPDILTDLIPIRSYLKDKFPSKSRATLGLNLEEMWNHHTKGVTYTSQKETEAISKLQVPLGQLRISVEQLVENFHAYIDDICKNQSQTQGPPITKVFLVAPPSRERFLLQVEKYVPGYEKTETEDEEDSDEEMES